MAEDDHPFFTEQEISSFRLNEDLNGYPNQEEERQQDDRHGPFGINKPTSQTKAYSSSFQNDDKMDQENEAQIPQQGFFLRSEAAGNNYELLANILEEPIEDNTRLDFFYQHNKVMQGLNCFLLLDNKTSAHRPSSFSENPNFYLENIFDEKFKNDKSIPQQNNAQKQQSQQQDQQQNISYPVEIQDNSQLEMYSSAEDRTFLSEFISGYTQQEVRSEQPSSYLYSNQNGLHQNNQINTNFQQHSQNNAQNGNLYITNNKINQHPLELENQQNNAHYNNEQNSNLNQSQQQQPPRQLFHPNQNQQYKYGDQQQNPTHNFEHQKQSHTLHSQQQLPKISHLGQVNHQVFNHQPFEGINKGSSKNAFLKSSTSFLDKVTDSVEKFSDLVDPNEYPTLGSEQEFLLKNLKNYIALELFKKEQTSFFSQILNSSYQIFLHRLKLLIDQKRMDTKTLLPFICRFSIDLAEKLLHFISKCDDAFTMKIIRENPSPYDEFSPEEQEFLNGLQLRELINTSKQKQNLSTPSNATSVSYSSHSSVSGLNHDTHQKGQNMYEVDREEISENTRSHMFDSQVQSEAQGSSSIQFNQQKNLSDKMEEDCLPFHSCSINGQLNENKIGLRKQWTKQQQQILQNLYQQYSGKIPLKKMEELAKSFDRSISSIYSKINKIRKINCPITIASIQQINDNWNQQDATIFNDFEQINEFPPFNQQNQSQLKAVSEGNEQSVSNHLNNQISYSSNNHVEKGISGNTNQNHQGMNASLKMELKLKICLFEFPQCKGTKSQILEKMRDKYYPNLCDQGGSWEKSSSQMLSGPSFQKKRGIFSLKEEVQSLPKEQLDSSATNKQKLICILSQLPQRGGTLQEILDAYKITFGNGDDKKLKETISKTLNTSSSFDKSFSKTIYYLTQEEASQISTQFASQYQQQSFSQTSNDFIKIENNFCEPYLQQQSTLSSHPKASLLGSEAVRRLHGSQALFLPSFLFNYYYCYYHYQQFFFSYSLKLFIQLLFIQFLFYY